MTGTGGEGDGAALGAGPPGGFRERWGGAGDGRLSSPAAERNTAPIVAALGPLLAGVSGAVLEIGSGTGQHGAAIAAAFPDILWQPSEADARNMASIAGWAAGVENIRPPIRLDAMADWAGSAELAELGPLAGVFSANVIHIAPWGVAEGIVAGAGRCLAPGGRLIFYGPFRETGAHVSEGNIRFDASLRAQDARFGIRDLEAVAALATEAGLGPAAVTEMPANNRLVAFARPPA